MKCLCLQFRKMLSRELSQLSEMSECGNEISEYIYSTFLGKLFRTNKILRQVDFLYWL